MKITTYIFISFLWALAVSFTAFGNEWLEMRVNMGYVLAGCWLLFLAVIWLTGEKKAFRTGFAFSLTNVVAFIIYGVAILGVERFSVVPAAIIREGLGITKTPFHVINYVLYAATALYLVIAFFFARNSKNKRRPPNSLTHTFSVRLHQKLSFTSFFDRVHKKSNKIDAVFMPGCSVSGYNPKLVLKAFDYLNMKQSAALFTGCCGKPTKLIGREVEYKKYRQKTIDTLKPLNCPIIVCCQSCYEVLRESGLPAVFLWEYIVRHGIPVSDEGAHLSAQPSDTRKIAAIPGNITLKMPCRASKETTGNILEILRQKDLGIQRTSNKCCQTGAEDSNTISCCGECRNIHAGGSHKAYHLLDVLFGDDGIDINRRGSYQTWKNRINLARSLNTK